MNILKLYSNGKLTDSMIVLYLYLLHGEDYSFNISRNIRKAKCNNLGRSLMMPNHASHILRDMKRLGMVDSIRIRDGGRKRVYYKVNPAVIFGGAEPETSIFKKATKKIIAHIAEQEGKSKDPIKILQRIALVEKFDLLTILLYFEELVIKYKDFTELVEFPHHPTHEWTTGILYLEELHRLLDHIVRSQRGFEPVELYNIH